MDTFQFAAGYQSVGRFIRKLRGSHTPEACAVIETPPGEEAQVDFGLGAPIIDSNGQRRRPHVLRVVLSHSRKAYSEVISRQTTDAFIGCVDLFARAGAIPNGAICCWRSGIGSQRALP